MGNSSIQKMSKYTRKTNVKHKKNNKTWHKQIFMFQGVCNFWISFYMGNFDPRMNRLLPFI